MCTGQPSASRSVFIRGPILGIIGVCFFVVGVVVFAVLPMSDMTVTLAGVSLLFAFACLIVVSCARGWCRSNITVNNHGDASRVPVVTPIFPLFIAGPMRVEYHGLNSV